ncbi:MAG: DNA translocase FtsK [Ilumatobacteraceae bacterium]
MPTYGKSNRRSRNDPLPPTPARGARRAPAEATGPMRRRDQASAELREAVEGREDEFWGIGFIGVGVLLGLAIYFQLAGPLGRGVSTLVGWFTGLGKFIVPICLVGVGVALVRKGRSGHRFRLAIGWALTGVSILAVLHVVRRGPTGSTRWARPWMRWWASHCVPSWPARSAIVVLAALFLGGVMLITRTSVRTLAHQSARSVGAVAGPLSRRLRDAVGNVASLRSEREGQGELPPPSPELYDFEADDDWAAAEAPLPGRKAPMPRKPPCRRRAAGEQAELELGPGAQRGQWTLPPMNYLGRSTNQSVNKAEVEARGRTLVDSLASHGVETRLVGQTVGPTVTRYELELGPGVKVARITSLNRDIAYAMAATDVRILAPIPGRSAIGVEVPNHTRQLVSLGDIMTAPEAKTAAQTLDVAIGKDIAGRAVFLNLATTPHLLIAGTTGAGKSSGINCIITSLLMRTTPDQVRLILVDPKQVEMGQYNRLPHLLTAPVTNPKKAANALGWACKEMDRRYDLLFEVGFRDISGYNAAFDRGELVGEPGSDKVYERLPFIVVVVDELNDLMMVAARDVEESITRIAQKARAVGIHLIVATQRPSVNVITGVIKANIPARIAYAVNSLTDSRVILDQPGAEKLVGKGDMLLLPGNSNVSQRIQGSFVSEEEVRKVVAHWRRQAPEVVYVSGVEGDEGEGQLGGGGGFGGGDDDEDEALMRQAMELVVRSQLGSTSMLQRKLKVGFARAGRIMDLLEQRGVVGPSEGSKARAVLMTVEEYELLYPQRGG